MKENTQTTNNLTSMRTRKIPLVSTAALALGAMLLLGPNAMAADQKTKLNASDTQFIQEEAAAGVALVKMAELGEKKAQREEVKAFAAMLVTDHTKANAELAALAASKGVQLSSEPADKHVDMQEKLESKSGAEFDKEFLSMVVDGHEECVENFEEASTDAQDSDVKAWATKMLPGLQAHLAKAESLSPPATVKGTTTSTNTPASQPDRTTPNVPDRDATPLTLLDQGNSKN